MQLSWILTSALAVATGIYGQNLLYGIAMVLIYL